MGNFFENLGGALFSPGGTDSSITQLETMSPEQKALFKQLLGTATSQMGQATPSYPNQSYVSTLPIEQSYMDLASGKDTSSPAGQALLNVLQGKPAYDINPEATQSYYENSIRDPMVREFNKTTLPGLTESFSGPGFWSSNRANATTDAYSDLQNNLMTQWGNLQYMDETARRQALENAAGRQATGAQNAVTNAGNAGAYARQIEQEKVASDLARWLSGEAIDGRSVSAYNPNTQLALSLLGVQPFTYAQESTTTGKGLFNQILGNINVGMNMGGSSND
jgi:hypothetical protein